MAQQFWNSAGLLSVMRRNPKEQPKEYPSGSRCSPPWKCSPGIPTTPGILPHWNSPTRNHAPPPALTTPRSHRGATQTNGGAGGAASLACAPRWADSAACVFRWLTGCMLEVRSLTEQVGQGRWRRGVPKGASKESKESALHQRLLQCQQEQLPGNEGASEGDAGLGGSLAQSPRVAAFLCKQDVSPAARPTRGRCPRRSQTPGPVAAQLPPLPPPLPCLPLLPLIADAAQEPRAVPPPLSPSIC